MKTLDLYRRNIFSQNGEDGLLEEILRRVDIHSRTCVEFGAWDGKHGSNTYNLVRQGWRAVYVEAEPTRFRDLQATAAEHPGQIEAIQGLVEVSGPMSLDAILADAAVEPEFGVLSVDIDSEDWRVWRSLRGFRPAIVVIEIDSSIPPGVRSVYEPSRRALGTSFSSMLALGREKGYALVAHTGNMVFVRDDLTDRLALTEEELAYPEVLFDPSWLGRSDRRARIELRLARLANAGRLHTEQALRRVTSLSERAK
jgi:hypothetical protein